METGECGFSCSCWPCPASEPGRPLTGALTSNFRATGLGLVSLASVAGAILSLTIISQTPSLLPIFLCCVLAIVAFSLSSLLPETRDQPLSESLKHSSQIR